MTLRIEQQRPQWLAAAWLRETGEHRPALDILQKAEGEVVLSPVLRAALADWIKGGCKRRRGCSIPADPWSEYPPKMSLSLGLPRTDKERRAWMLFVTYPNVYGVLAKGKRGRPGRPRTLETDACEFVAKRMEVDARTARGWMNAWWPDGPYSGA